MKARPRDKVLFAIELPNCSWIILLQPKSEQAMWARQKKKLRDENKSKTLKIDWKFIINLKAEKAGEKAAFIVPQASQHPINQYLLNNLCKYDFSYISFTDKPFFLLSALAQIEHQFIYAIRWLWWCKKRHQSDGAEAFKLWYDALSKALFHIAHTLIPTVNAISAMICWITQWLSNCDFV